MRNSIMINNPSTPPTLETIDKKLALLIQKVDGYLDKTDAHDGILRGQNGNIGLREQVRQNTRDIADFKKALWMIVTPLLLAIGGGIILLITQGVGR